MNNRIGKFLGIIHGERFFCDLGKINYPVKINFEIKCNLETEIIKLFESRKKVAAITAPDTKIIFTDSPYVNMNNSYMDSNLR